MTQPIIPSPITVNTGEEHEIHERIDNYFLSVRNYVTTNYKTNAIGFEI